ncbi:nucleotide exchange factor GrpE [Parabacteroides sp. Marseille-P3160]|uniref:nucleotide exchange factor GrpE n=1 Tax=Parabacteroides sp. Marseille-P3160 TaxID=1917887 RepID=UPI0009BBA38D|nr:nucleotide exchange factor GrpE [Parabacteroides sp. Marseille-P3160]
MDNKNTEINPEDLPQEEAGQTNSQNEQENTAGEPKPSDNVAELFHSLETKYEELNGAHLRLMAEFDNYRKRTLREKADLIRNGAESALTSLLPIVDDFERALANIQKTEDVKAATEGVQLIYNKFLAYLTQQGVKPIDAIGKPFDSDTYDAVATIPAPEDELKGKILDCVQTGYTLNDKVIRHAKVVVGE